MVKPHNICRLECDSPSIPPSSDEYLQCGCDKCVAHLASEWVKKRYRHCPVCNKNHIPIEATTSDLMAFAQWLSDNRDHFRAH